MKPLSRHIYAIASIVLASVLFVSVNMVSDVWLRSARVDLTEGGLFTVSEGTRATLAKLEEPIKLRFFYSRGIAADYAQVRAYAARIRDLLQEYVALSKGKLSLEEIDPVPYTQAEDEALAFNITPIPTQEDEQIYFGLAGTNSIDGQLTIPFFNQNREQYLEYDLTSFIYQLSLPAKPKLGIITSLPLATGAGGFMAMMQGQAQPFMIYEQLRQAFDIQMLDQDADKIPSDIGVLMIVHPKQRGDRTLYAIDQFVMRGGHAIVFVDPLSEIANNTMNMGPGVQAAATSSLEPLLTAWGVRYDPSKVIADGGRAQRVRLGRDSAQGQVDYIVWLRLSSDNPDGSDFSPTDTITSNLNLLNFATAGALGPLKGATTKFSPLVRSSALSSLLDTSMIRIMARPQDLVRAFKPQGDKLIIGARISGPAKSAYPKGSPKSGETPRMSLPAPHHINDAKNIDVIIVADSDIFDDRFWVQVQDVLGQRMAVPTADNAAFVVNAVENMMGSPDLISLRTRARSDRPFTVVDELRRNAETRFRAEAEQLQIRVTEAEARLRELQGGSETIAQPGTAKGEMLSPAQQQAIEKFRRELLESRAALRQVQANLRADVERLGARLAFINIALVPILVSAFAIGLAWVRRRRRTRARGL
ncbi:MAG: Gldg family protein [Alphaproteobacteria bacterium]